MDEYKWFRIFLAKGGAAVGILLFILAVASVVVCAAVIRDAQRRRCGRGGISWRVEYGFAGAVCFPAGLVVIYAERQR